MKKNNSYLADNEIDLGDFILLVWREKILILSISIICGLAGYLFSFFQPQNFKTEIKLKNPPTQLFEPYSNLTNNSSNNSNSNSNKIAEQFINNFQLNFISLDNLESFLQESRNLDNFKEYLKSKNITAKKYFEGKFGEVKEKNNIILNKYFLVFEKNLEGDIFLNNYAEFIKKKNIIEFKKNLKLSIENIINSHEQALEIAKLINLENPILKSLDNQSQVINEPEALFYRGTKVLTSNIMYFKKISQKLENDQFNYELILDKATSPLVLQALNPKLYFVLGLISGSLLSLVIIFLKNILKQKL